MKPVILFSFFIVAIFLFAFRIAHEGAPPKMYSPLTEYIKKIQKDFDKIPEDRKVQLNKVASFIQTKLSAGEKINLIFICTHNSRRSHMGQLWATAAAEYYDIKEVSCYSGGLEVTAFNPNAIKALTKAGFKINKEKDGANPIYMAKYADDAPAVKSFSKKYMDAPNPTNNFAAIMTCSHADETCPIVQGAAIKISTPYDDPKVADGTPQQEAVYDERCKQIATEVFYAFSLVKSK